MYLAKHFLPLRDIADITAIDIIPANSFTRRWMPGGINDYIMF